MQNILLLPRANIMELGLYIIASWTLTKRMEKKLDGNYMRMLQFWTSPGGNT